MKFRKCLQILFVSSFMMGSCMAATITVNSLDDDIDDDGNCTLREAIESADRNSASGVMAGECAAGEPPLVRDVIEFSASLSGSINITASLPSITETIFINGPGADVLSIDGGNLPVDANPRNVLSIFGSGSVEISGLTFENTITTSLSPVRTGSNTTITDCIFQDNQSDSGGALEQFGDLTIQGTIFRRNTATLFQGGAISVLGSDLTLIIRNSLFEDNQTLGEFMDGGAIYAGSDGHGTIITGSTFTNNHATGDGGALSISGGAMQILNSTFTANSADKDGGAIEFKSDTSILANTTISGNIADADDNGSGAGGGVLMWSDSDEVRIRNSIIAGNISLNGQWPDCFGNYDSEGYNLIGVKGSDCSGFEQGINGDQVGTLASPIDPLLLELADNGGRTPTMALEASSPASGGGNPAGCFRIFTVPLAVDQRGEPRPAPEGTTCDIGAFELNALPTFRLTTSVDGSGRITSAPTGIDCPDDCSESFPTDETVTLTATPVAGAQFLNWEGDCTGTGACTVTMNGLRQVIANFSEGEDVIFSDRFE